MILELRPGLFAPAFFCLVLTGSKGVVAGDLGEVAGVVEGEDADVVAASHLEAVDAAV